MGWSLGRAEELVSLLGQATSQYTFHSEEVDLSTYRIVVSVPDAYQPQVLDLRSEEDVKAFIDAGWPNRPRGAAA